MIFENLKRLRGLFYRKLMAESKEEEPLPGFRLEKTTRIIELPVVSDPTKMNVIYPLMEPFSYANIKWDPEENELIYFVIEPVLNENEKKVLEKISDALIQLVDVTFASLKEIDKAIDYLQKQVNGILKDYGIQLTQNQYVKLMYMIYRNFIGYNEIDSLLQDGNIEDISCDGMNTPVYVVHRKYGSIKTNVSFGDANKLRDFVIKLSERCGRYVSYAEPILDGTLPDGSRVSATIAGDVATRGPTFTIRKFSERPLSPVELMNLNTATPELMAYFWYLVEMGANILFVGGTATGKTTFLNSVCMFIPPEKKIVSIEDTREIHIPHEHWISGVTRSGFGIPLPTGEKYGEITMFDLLRESFRQNPDFVIVGETRGKEAYVMFQGMASGHTSFSTFHANSVDTVVKRLTSPPIELSPVLIESLNVIAIMSHTKEEGKPIRRVREIVEIISVDPRTEEVKTNLVFLWNPATDNFEKVNDSQILARLVRNKGGSEEQIKDELEKRQTALEWLISRDIKDYTQFVEYVNMYYKEPEKLFEMMGKDWKKKEEKKEVPVEVVKEEPEPVKEPMAEDERPQKRTSILELLGFRVLQEAAH
ncbi:MAG: type II/IV secretion system ATPase subunit [Candidatus Aenigmarchaeota archaeon]|nr:type II/IV secretion system ATPase subunit [Candidatus Aenigmarchaeota archaeon]